MRYFSSDTHFGHNNIIKYCERPFSSTDEMNRALMAPLRELKQYDDLYFLGDWSMSPHFLEFIKKLDCFVHFIYGNHDRLSRLKKLKEEIPTKIEIHKSLMLDIGGLPVQLIHDPAQATEHYVLCGHVHTAWPQHIKPDHHWINVGVDVRGFKPMTEEEVISLFDEAAE